MGIRSVTYLGVWYVHINIHTMHMSRGCRAFIFLFWRVGGSYLGVLLIRIGVVVRIASSHVHVALASE